MLVLQLEPVFCSAASAGCRRSNGQDLFLCGHINRHRLQAAQATSAVGSSLQLRLHKVRGTKTPSRRPNHPIAVSMPSLPPLPPPPLAALCCTWQLVTDCCLPPSLAAPSCTRPPTPCCGKPLLALALCAALNEDVRPMSVSLHPVCCCCHSRRHRWLPNLAVGGKQPAITARTAQDRL